MMLSFRDYDFSHKETHHIGWVLLFSIFFFSLLTLFEGADWVLEYKHCFFLLDLHIPSISEYIFVKLLILWILYDCWYCCYQKNWKLFQFVVVVFDWKI